MLKLKIKNRKIATKITARQRATNIMISQKGKFKEKLKLKEKNKVYFNIILLLIL